MKHTLIVLAVLILPALTQAQDASAVLIARSDSKVSGTLSFHTNSDGSVSIQGALKGLSPNTSHGFHVHQYGDCSSPDGTSAGGHFNPESSKHGGPEMKERHVGDLGNITANDSGEAQIDISDKHLSLSGDHSIIGRAVVVHGGTDDLKSQPSGAAGPRIACGVIGISAK